MILLSEKLSSFKGTKALTIQTGGKDIVISGENGSGKTTALDGYLWTLTGRDSLGQASFDIKTLNPDGTVAQHGIDHEVEITLEIDGNPVTLRKVYKEIWKTTRGSADKQFSGHEVNHFIDGVPKDKRDFDIFVASICDPKKLITLSKPTHFNELPDSSKDGPGWQQRRRILIEAFGDVSDAEVMGSVKKFKPLADALKGKVVDDYKTMITRQRKEVVKSRADIPGRIDELNRTLAEETKFGTSLEVSAAINADKMRAQLKQLQAYRAEILAGGQAAELTKRLRELEAEGQEIYNRLRQEALKAQDDAARTLRQAKFVLDGEMQKRDVLLSQRTICNTELQGVENRLKELMAEYTALKLKTFEIEDTLTCPVCKQALPGDQVEEARRRGMEEFNLQKAGAIERNVAMGKEYKAKEKLLREKIDAKTEEIEKLEVSIENMTEARDDAQMLFDTYDTEQSDQALDYVKCQEKQETLKKEIAAAGSSIDTSDIDAEIEQCETDIRAQDEAAARHKAQAEAKARIRELSDEEKAMGAEIEEIDKMLILIEEFTRAKVARLDDRINSKFSLVKWKLSEIQINEGVKECCVCTVNGVPEPSLNHAMRIQAGIEIINVLSDAWGIVVPCWIDGAESVNDIPETRGQQIALMVSRDKKLKVTTR